MLNRRSVTLVLFFIFNASIVIAAKPLDRSIPSSASCNLETAAFSKDPGGSEVTRWELCWKFIPASQYFDPDALVAISWARFRTSPAANWVQVIGSDTDGVGAHVSEIFIPYHDNSERFHDVTTYGQSALDLTADSDCKDGTLINGKVCREIRDRGLRWRGSTLGTHTTGGRGQELVLWSILESFNYKYVIEWIFQDNGTFSGRVAPTGNIYHNPGRPHTHTIAFRLDVDLNGSTGDSIDYSTHVEGMPDPLKATDVTTWVAKEKGLPWMANSFNTLSIKDIALKNSKRNRISYELSGDRLGAVQHLGANEKWTQSGFWVTQYHHGELSARFLSDYISNDESVLRKDVVVWYVASLHHTIRDEDYGSTELEWVGFSLRPKNLFSQTPFFP